MHEVLRIFFSPHDFRDAFPNIWAGFQVNLKLMVVAEALVLVFALAIAVIRGLPGRGARPLRALAIVYTDFFPRDAPDPRRVPRRLRAAGALDPLH